ncbi:cyclic-phosphate processing receiver domain-containing protein [Terrabacter sp. Ter38]|uniref:cyclic-phosphate processing receiver domain-containing protein n=1 Tax=Terrabacter sp. Ter38 TaxID=2926030 RepID=UPI0021184255|nr:cyclic-phosphate processing receiver domain-containing protein [Terrabacter sp. Ter38]
MHAPLFPGLRRAGSLVVLVDDTRAFRDRRPHLQVRRGDNAVALLSLVDDRQVDGLWLDYGLLDATTSAAAVDHLVSRAERGTPLRVGTIEVHSARVTEGLEVTQRLRRAGYPARPCYAQGIWMRFDAAIHCEWRPGAGGGVFGNRNPDDSLYEQAETTEVLHA